MANSDKQSGSRLFGTPQADAMFQVQENWVRVLTVLGGLVEQTRRAGFTRSQARGIVAATYIAEVVNTPFVTDPKQGEGQ